MLRHARQRKIDLNWTFYCAHGRPGEKDEEARALGARVVHSPTPISRKANFVRALRTELRRGKYDVLHCHHDLVNAVYLLAAAGLPIRRRIVHAHNADEALPTPSIFKQRLYREPMRQVCLAIADRVVGISNHTLDTFLGGRVRRPRRDLVHYYGVDPAPFENTACDRAGFRNELGLPAEALILLFAGRMVPEKNPVFAVDVLAKMHSLEPRVVLVFAGAGSQEQVVAARARELGVEHATRLLGWRNDVSRIMCCSDWFILPHPERPMEGLGLAVVEAQLAGLRLLLSRGIPDDPLLGAACFRRLPLVRPEQWAKAAMELLQSQIPSCADARAALADSAFAMDRALAELISLHKLEDD